MPGIAGAFTLQRVLQLLGEHGNGALSPVTHSSAATGFRSVPMPSTQAVMTSPGAR